MYDAIVIGARCAGAPTAMLLARRGHKVLLVDRSKFPSDVLHSTLWIHQPGVQLLKDWGVLDRVIATGCPAIRAWHVGMGPLVFRGSPPPAEGGQVESYAPRRYLLDQILADAAVQAGAEFRDEVTVEELVMDGDRVAGIRARTGSAAPVTERARLVIGADGIHSRVAAHVAAPEYNVQEARLSACYTYFSGVPMAEGAQA
ncbi:MAG TPA: FAD-dependent monooxygenase, partial [Kofleriaceae bacterium]|nr:FAD-dependent monooxygenase [Kofleriaceae bacterium]